MLEDVEWGEFRLGSLFEIHSSKKIFHANKIDKIYEKQVNNSFPYVVRTTQNNGIRGYILEDEIYTNNENTLSFAQDTFSVFYQKQKYFTGNKVKILRAKFEKSNENIMQYLTASFQKSLNTLTWGVGSTIETIGEIKILLPVKNNEIDFDFMNRFIAELEAEHIAELEAYLTVSNLKDYTLTEKEQKVINHFKKGKIEFGKFTYSRIFNKIFQGRRLRKEDQISGNIPFVMAGTTNTGVVNYISNPVASFPKNSITIDIFGNTFYRNYDFGAGDDTGVYWNDKKNYSKETMLFFTTSMKKSLVGKFDFGKKLRSSQSFNFTIQLPTNENQPDYKTMETFISAIQKLVIKDVVLYADSKIDITKEVVNN
jgi:hypothetical protein